MTWTDSLTVLREITGRPVGKAFKRNPDGTLDKIPYGKAKYFEFGELEFNDIHGLSQHLMELEKAPDCMIIRGRPKLGVSASLCRRLKSNFEPAARRWLMVDADKLDPPADLDIRKEPEAAARYVISMLPPEFADVSCHWKASSSAGVENDRISMHLFFCVHRPYWDDELKRWAVAWNAKCRFKLIDPPLFHEIQPHFTAAPLFLGSMVDPLPRRSGLIGGRSNEVPLIIPDEPTRRLQPDHLDIEEPMCPKTGRKLDGRNRGGVGIRWTTYKHLSEELGTVDLQAFAERSWARFCAEYDTGPTEHSSKVYTWEGWLDVCRQDLHRIRAKVRGPILGIAPPESATEMSLKEASKRLTHAIASFMGGLE